MPPHQLGFDTTVRRAGTAPFTTFDDELLAIDVERGFLYSLNETAGQVWSAIATPTPVAEVCRHLAFVYDVDAAMCERDVISLLQELHLAGLVEVVDASR